MEHDPNKSIEQWTLDALDLSESTNLRDLTCALAAWTSACTQRQIAMEAIRFHPVTIVLVHRTSKVAGGPVDERRFVRATQWCNDVKLHDRPAVWNTIG